MRLIEINAQNYSVVYKVCIMVKTYDHSYTVKESLSTLQYQHHFTDNVLLR